ncbi:VWA domain-containing protein [Alcaligenaceae bacterium]|nr:VWA domain-containing protein [Alcaligenaceae bacterium]
MKYLFNAAAFATAIAFSATAVAAERAMIIFDASGSMWGQIDGKPKHEIARQALRDVLGSVSPSTELGLMAYGHREKGNCNDIEVLVAPAANSKDAIIRAADKLKFLGKTPLSAAVAQAAEALRYTEDKATVILITDGEETCQADPCALGAELKSKGVDFTAHVVGFDLTQQEGEQVACLASSTGGQYIKADDAEQLKKAMSNMVQILEAPVEKVVKAAEPEPKAVQPEAPQVTLQGPDTAVAASAIQVALTGSRNKNDYVTVVAPDAAEEDYGPYVRVEQKDQVTLQLPDALGTHEIRYVDDVSKRVLAKQSIELTETSATVTTIASAAAGSTIDVAWTGPNSPGDYITVVDVGAPDDEYGAYVRTAGGSPVKLLLPDQFGKYEVRYVLDGSKRVLASAPVMLEGVTATLALQNRPVRGGEIIVAWTGPNNSGDYVTVVPQGAAQDAYTAYARTASGPILKITAPAEAGEYEVRYVVDQSKRVLISIPMDLTEVSVSVSAPSSVAAGSTFSVEWTGPGNRNDFIEIVAHDAPVNAKPLNATRTSQGSPLQMFAPGIAGQYHVRYVMRDTKEVAAHVLLIVE